MPAVHSLDFETAEYKLVISPSARETDRPKPATSTVVVEFGAVSDTGKVRAQNEDHYLVSHISRRQEILHTNVPSSYFPESIREDGYTMVVADGMGGMAAGDVASRLAISTGMKLFHKSPKWGFKINQKEARELFDRVSSRLQDIDRTLTEYSFADRRLFGMGTTLTMAYSIGVDLFIIHLGDSRAYLYRNGTLRQLTKDHTVAQAMADAGYISHDEIRHHKKRNSLTNYLGGHDGKVSADIRWLRLADGDRLILSTDGLTEMVDDAGIARILDAERAPTDAAQALVNKALENGGKDNVTVIVANYQIPSMVAKKRSSSGDLKPVAAVSDSFEAPLDMSGLAGSGNGNPSTPAGS
jgi:protein phosphatase